MELEKEADAEDIDAYTGLAEVYMRIGEYEKALKEIDKAIEMVKGAQNKDYSNIYKIKFKILTRANRSEECLSFMKEAAAYGNFKDYLPCMLYAYDSMNLSSESRAIVDELYKNNKKDQNIAYEKMICCLLNNDVRKAKSVINKSRIYYTDNETWAYWNMLVQDFVGEYKDVLKYYMDIVETWTAKHKSRETDLSLQYGNIAQNLYFLGRMDEARTYAEKTIEDCDRELGKYILDEPLYLTRKARACMILGDEKQARELIEEARRMPLCRMCEHNFCKDALHFEALIEEMAGNYEKALELCKTGEKECPGETDFISVQNRIKGKMKKK